EVAAHDAEVDVPSGPLLAPSDGSEELTRSDEDRAVRAEIPGRRDREERGRHRRGRDRRDRDRSRGGAAQAPAPTPQAQAPGQAPSPARAPAPGKRAVLDVVLEVLRAGDGRPVHVRQLAEQAQKRGFLDGGPNDLL